MKRYVRLWRTYSFSCQDVADGVQEANCVSHLYNGGKISPLQLRPNLRFWNFWLVLSSGFRTIHDSKRCSHLCSTGLLLHPKQGLLSFSPYPDRCVCIVFQSLLTPQTPFYGKLGQECVAAGCSVDLFLFPNSYCDVATMADVVRLTSGNLYKYSYFQVSMWKSSQGIFSRSGNEQAWQSFRLLAGIKTVSRVWKLLWGCGSLQIILYGR